MDNITLRLVSDQILGVGVAEMCLPLRCQRGIDKHGMECGKREETFGRVLSKKQPQCRQCILEC